MMSFLVGSTFPLSLIRRRVVIMPALLDVFRKMLQERKWQSFWGHENTLAAAYQITGFDLRPAEARPAIRLNPSGYPELNGAEYRECWVLSPEYVPDYRPAIGEAVPADKILGWQVLRIIWEDLP